MSLRDRRVISSMTPEAKAKAQRLESEGRDPVTGKKEGAKASPCPACEVKAAGKRDASPAKTGTPGVSGENRGGAA
ncbi:MAG: hypothetical protein LBT00_08540 [Spirochaetaceae bacterium]|jgi:hypothetical protein|nr:hypothetical protein [Spirochaetaceae bacterium]